MLAQSKIGATKPANVFSLKELYDNKIPKEVQFILIDDEAADYDLLERSKIINQITATISNCVNKFGFTIALKGEWGSGKTTILNIVKEQLGGDSIIIIDDFNPWAYSSEKTLLMDLCDVIMRNISCGFSIAEINKFKKVYLKTITANVNQPFSNLFESNLNISRIKTMINNYLESNDKRIVIFLDNLERCSSGQVSLILKIIHNLFDFKRVIYILSYDEMVMRKLLESRHNIKYSFLEKIVQMEFTVPKINKTILQNVINVCLNNYLEHSSLQIDEEKHKEICKIISNDIKDLRDFKRIINSTFSASFHNRQNLNSIDALLIEIIALKNSELWDEISTQRKFFISEDRYIYENEYIYNSEKYNIDTTRYFNDLFENNKHNIKNYENILCHLFPNIKQYLGESKYGKKEKIEFISGYQSRIDRKEYKASVIDKRICNGKYFNLYFNKTENEFTKINSKIEEFLLFIKNNSNPTEIYEKYFEMEKIYPGWAEKYTLETLQLHLEEIGDEKFLSLLLVVYFSYYTINDSPLFFQLNARSRAQIIIADLIIKLSDDDFMEFIDEIKEDYQNIFLIKEIAYWLNPDNRHNELTNASRYEKIKNLCDDMINKIKAQNINIYSKQYYNKYNIVLLSDDKEYMSKIKQKLNNRNLPLFVLDFMSISTGSNGISYTINIEKINEYYKWTKIKSNIKTCKDSRLKEFLTQVIEKSDKPTEKSYCTDTYIDIDNLITDYLGR